YIVETGDNVTASAWVVDRPTFEPEQERAILEEIEQAKNLDVPISLMMINIDMFHIYNDLHGHAVGDRALSEMARVIRSGCRETDLIFRYSGDAFAVLALGSSTQDTYVTAEKMRKAVEAHTFPGIVEGRGFLTISIGIASFPEQSADAETLFFCSDIALLEAKKNGRNCVSIYSPTEAEQGTDEQPYQTNALLKSSQLSYLSTILALAATLDAKDPFTYGHSQKVSQYAVMLGEAIGISPEHLNSLRTAALLHDIGKIGIPDSLLLKPQKFTESEREEMQRHSGLAASILRYVPSLSNLLPHIVHHHERYDGGGYPDKLKGIDIPLEARILAIADSYDAMTSARIYRPTRSKQEAIEELRRCAGTQFDPELVDVFCKMIEPPADDEE
ncbi:MAG: diguanylate cyclase, partial [Chloroflexota bacterium]|nr:diguanylate cyclase [Chloroflexota bacterium]